MKRWRPFIAALSFLVYATQALAAAGVSCPWMNHAGDHHSHGVGAHAAHDSHLHHASMDSGDHAHHGQCHDCCGSGLCFMSHCHALLALPTAPAGLFHLPPDGFEHPVAVAALVRPAASHFRPPTYA